MNTHPEFADLSIESQGRIDDACDAFEAAWVTVMAQADQSGAISTKVGSSFWPNMETFLHELDDREKIAALRELIPIDVAYRRRCGAPVTLMNYSRFPEVDADWLTEIVVNPEGRTDRQTKLSGQQERASAKAKQPPPTIDQFVERVVASRLLDQKVVQAEVSCLNEKERSAAVLGERMVSRGLLTPFQFSSLMRLSKPALMLGEYIILSPIGRGGMGAVYRARHRRMDRVVAVKVLPPSIARDPQAASRFSREIRAIARLSHPNIVAAHDAGEESGVSYLVMECIEGTDLATEVRSRGPLSVAHAVECLMQAAEGLEYAHAQGVIHRDIKPSNLIECPLRQKRESSTGDGESVREMAATRIKVLDLGLARFQADATSTREGSVLTRTGMMFGTPEYMAPEQAVNASSVDARADIYSLGCTLYFLLAGRPVLAGGTYLEIVMAHQLQALPSLKAAQGQVPDELEQIYRRMTARKPDLRFASMHEVIEALKALPADRLSRIRMPAESPAMRQSMVSEVANATEWFAPLNESETERNPTVIISDLDEPSAPKPDRTDADRQKTVDEGDSPLMVRLQKNRTRMVAAVVVIAAVAMLGLLPWMGSLLSSREQTVPRRDQGIPVIRPQSLPFPAEKAVVHRCQQEWAAHLKTQPIMTNGQDITMCLIPPGEFMMGTPDAEFDALPSFGLNGEEIQRVQGERPPHRVVLTKPFWISQTEVTVGQFRRFVDDTSYLTETEKTSGWGIKNSQWTFGPGYSWKNVGEAALTERHPASNLTWNDAVMFCEWLSRVETRTAGRTVRYRLPTEAEWEYCCRAGTSTAWYFGSELDLLRSHACYSANSGGRLQPVGNKLENPFRLLDMIGNQAEWCSDWFGPYSAADAIDPTGPATGTQRVQRGGNFADQPLRLRSASRQGRLQSSPQDGCIRVVLEVVE